MHRCGCLLTVWFSLSLFIFYCFFIFLCLCLSTSSYVPHTFALCPFCVHLLFVLFFCMLLLSLAWNGDWKPPKVWGNCKSQKQPAQQPCKSTRNFLWKGHERKWNRKPWLNLKAVYSSPFLLRSIFTYLALSHWYA